jgi:hypothetical protein
MTRAAAHCFRSCIATRGALTKFVIDFDHDGYPSRCTIDACGDDMPDSEHVLCAISGVGMT